MKVGTTAIAINGSSVDVGVRRCVIDLDRTANPRPFYGLVGQSQPGNDDDGRVRDIFLANNTIRKLSTQKGQLDLRSETPRNYQDFAVGDVDVPTSTFTVTSTTVQNGNWRKDGKALYLFGADLPAPLTACPTMYFVVNAAGDDFQLAATYGGTPITLSDAGSGGTIGVFIVEGVEFINNLWVGAYDEGTPVFVYQEGTIDRSEGNVVPENGDEGDYGQFYGLGARENWSQWLARDFVTGDVRVDVPYAQVYAPDYEVDTELQPLVYVTGVPEPGAQFEDYNGVPIREVGPWSAGAVDMGPVPAEPNNWGSRVSIGSTKAGV